jgi:predicted TIM-barrel fold metal-dependent hydrolase
VEEFAFDTCRAITSVINSGLLERCTQIRFLFSHNGGAFPFLADRIGAAHLNDLIAKANNGMDLRQVLSTRNIYLDTSISSSMQYPVLKDLGIPTEHLLYATDYPYTKRTDNFTYLAGYEAPKKSGVFDDTEMEDILYRNSLKVFPRIAKEFERFEKA